jgi:hypothetical protein
MVLWCMIAEGGISGSVHHATQQKDRAFSARDTQPH